MTMTKQVLTPKLMGSIYPNKIWTVNESHREYKNEYSNSPVFHTQTHSNSLRTGLLRTGIFLFAIATQLPLLLQYDKISNDRPKRKKIKQKCKRTVKVICHPQNVFFPLFKVSPQFLIMGISTLKPLKLGKNKV